MLQRYTEGQTNRPQLFCWYVLAVILTLSVAEAEAPRESELTPLPSLFNPNVKRPYFSSTPVIVSSKAETHSDIGRTNDHPAFHDSPPRTVHITLEVEARKAFLPHTIKRGSQSFSWNEWSFVIA